MQHERRTIRRRLPRVVLLFVVAFVVNVWVAWGLAVWRPLAGYSKDWTSNSVLFPISPFNKPAFDVNYGAGVVDGSPWSVRFVHPVGIETDIDSDYNYYQLVYSGGAFGFPFRALRWGEFDPQNNYRSIRGNVPRSNWLEGGIALPDGDEGRYGIGTNRLPLVPIPLGFVLNTFIYAMSIALALGLITHMRRLRRFERGLCPDCGYDAQGLSACPECGRAAPTTTR